MLRTNDRLGHYTLVHRLGRGGFSEVWLAEDFSKATNNKVALKLVDGEETDFTAFEKEAKLWAETSGHPNILPIIGTNQYDDRFVIVSEYAQEGSLKDFLKRNGNKFPSEESAIRVILGVLTGLEYLHGKNIIHRDLKPANILLQNGNPLLADFGISKIVKNNSKPSSNVSGTLAYMPPEAFWGKQDKPSDLWAVGVILYQLLSGTLPFQHQQEASLMYAIVNEDPNPLPNYISENLCKVVFKALEKDLHNRYKTAKEMLFDLETVLFDIDNNDTLQELPLEAFFTTGERKNSTQDMESVNEPVCWLDEMNDYYEEIEFLTTGTGNKLKQLNKDVFWQSHIFETVILDVIGKEVLKEKKESKYFLEDLGNDLFLEMTEIPSGKILMGSSANEVGALECEWPQHCVSIQSVSIGIYPITQAQWKLIMGNNPACFKGDRLPVEQISWFDAIEFCRKLSAKVGRYYRLPTEAEWEYACRAETSSPFAFGESICSKLANFDGDYPYAKSPRGINRGHTISVGKLGIANRFGLYEMHGNVWEWCQDTWHSNYEGCPTDGSAWIDEKHQEFRVVRGGAWNDPAEGCRSAFRGYISPNLSLNYVGLRIVAEF